MNGIDFRAVRRHFGRAAKTYEAAAALPREVESRLLESLVFGSVAYKVLHLSQAPVLIVR